MAVEARAAPAASPAYARGMIGRDAELGQINSLVAGLVGGAGGTLSISGAAGIGKSALAGEARREAESTGVRVLTVTGVEAEAELAFASLQQLLRPVADHLDNLAAPQRQALMAAFGLASDVDPDPYRVGLAAHELLTDAAAAAPTLLILDDAHCLDRSSGGVLSFLARRLEHEPIGLIATLREGRSSAFADLKSPTVELGPLGEEASEALLDRAAPDLDPVTRGRVLSLSAGNPLALVELARTLPRTTSTDRFLQEPPTLTARLELAFASSLDAIPEPTRLCLLAAALDPRISVEEALECASALHGSDVTVEMLDPATAAGIVDIADTQLRFRHPLIQSAVRSEATAVTTLSMYAALADVVSDPERALWHRGMAAIGCDDDLAQELDEHAAEANRRGAPVAAAVALERSVALTSDPRRKAERTVRAAELAYELGLTGAVRRLLTDAEALELGQLETARLAWLRQMMSDDVWVAAGATKTFVTIAEQMAAAHEPDLALRSLIPAAHRCWWTHPQERTRRYLVAAAQDLALGSDDAALLAVVSLAHPEETARSVLGAVSRQRPAHADGLYDAFYLGIAAEKAGDFVRARACLARAIEVLRDAGQLGLLAQALVHHAWTAANAGDFATGAAAGTEAAGLARDTHQHRFALTGELVAAWSEACRGNPEVAEIIDEPGRALAAMNAGPMLALAHLARGAADLGAGRYEAAFRHLWPVFDPNRVPFHRYVRWTAVLDLAEAGSHSGRSKQVTAAFTELKAIADRTRAPILRAGLICARPLLAADDGAERLYREALDHDLGQNEFMRARTAFSFGCWLRRQRRSADSRSHLREAAEAFDRLGAAAWSARARQELRASGEKLGPRTPDGRDNLTTRELKIAELASQGLSNREIGEQLFISPRTVGYHLGHVFAKLGVSSRGHLQRALTGAAGP